MVALQVTARLVIKMGVLFSSEVFLIADLLITARLFIFLRSQIIVRLMLILSGLFILLRLLIIAGLILLVGAAGGAAWMSCSSQRGCWTSWQDCSYLQEADYEGATHLYIFSLIIKRIKLSRVHIASIYYYCCTLLFVTCDWITTVKSANLHLFFQVNFLSMV